MRFFLTTMSICALLFSGCDSATPIAEITPTPSPTPTSSIEDPTESQPVQAEVVTTTSEDSVNFNELRIDTSSLMPGDIKTAKSRLKDLNSGLSSDLKAWKAAVAAAATEDEKRAIFTNQNPIPKFIDDALKLSFEFHKTQSGVNAALAAFSRSQEPQKTKVMNFVLENFSGKLNYPAMISTFQADVPSPQIEGWLKKMIDFAPAGETKARAMTGYTKYLQQLPQFKDAFVKNPQVLARLPQDQQDYLTSRRTPQEISELEGVLETVIKDYSDIKYLGRRTFADVARAELFELQNLGIGCVAPEIVGNDFDGIEFKLSDYRGKVVMLDFWGHWCPPCRAMYPHEQQLVNDLGSKPFVLIGMNSDRNLSFAQKAVQNEGLTWRNYWDGPKGQAGPISRTWNVVAWPTVYLIDAEGVIRYKGIQGEEIDRALEQMLGDMGHVVHLDGGH